MNPECPPPVINHVESYLVAKNPSVLKMGQDLYDKITRLIVNCQKKIQLNFYGLGWGGPVPDPIYDDEDIVEKILGQF